MDTVSDLPFTLLFTKAYEFPMVMKCTHFYNSESDALNNHEPTVIIEENDPIDITFNAPPGSRLYLDALDIIPIDYGCKIDEEGRIFHDPTDAPLPLYRINDNEFDELRVDNFLMEIKLPDHSYFGWVCIQPKLLSISEWEIMIRDLEKEAAGLSQDIVQKNIGFGDLESISIPPKQLRQFLIFTKHASRFLAALYDITNKPHFNIKTEYIEAEREKDVNKDTKSIRMDLQRPNFGRYILAPQKQINYDTRDNRQLKKIIKYCFERIREFHNTVEHLLNEQLQDSPYTSSSQYKIKYQRNLQQYEEKSNKLMKMVNIISNQDWYREVSDFSDGRSSHSFALDPSFAFIDKVYRELKNEEFSVKIDPVYSFSRKKSSQLYEVWCFLTVCRILGQKYNYDENEIFEQAGDGLLFAQLKSGKQIAFNDEQVRILVSYDRKVPTSARNCSLESDPFYYDPIDDEGTVHNRPDIRVDIYSISQKTYLGSTVIECKYRKIRNFYKNSTYNSREQIESYYSYAASEFYFNDLSKQHNVLPVLKVMVVTPDSSTLPRGRRKENIKIYKLRPGDAESIDIIKNALLEVINDRIKVINTR